MSMRRAEYQTGELHQMPFGLYMLTVPVASTLTTIVSLIFTDSIGISEVFKKI